MKNSKGLLQKSLITTTIIGGITLIPTSAIGSDSTTVWFEDSAIPDLVTEVRRIFQKIENGEYESAARDILNALGILNPAHESTEVGKDTESTEEGENPYDNPETPREVYEAEQHADVVRSEIPQKLSQVVFSPSGQEAMAQQILDLNALQQSSASAQQYAGDVAVKSSETADKSETLAVEIENKSTEAQSVKSSQEVLKALAEQNRDLAQLMSGNSTQLSNLAEIGAYQAVQLTNLNGSLNALNEKAQVSEIFVASQNYLMSQIDSALDQQNDYQEYKDSLENNLNRNMSRMIFIPGLF